jgi:hypothetical protein
MRGVMAEKIKKIIEKILDSLPSPEPLPVPARAKKVNNRSGR